jgi:hypothetical protein
MLWRWSNCPCRCEIRSLMMNLLKSVDYNGKRRFLMNRAVRAKAIEEDWNRTLSEQFSKFPRNAHEFHFTFFVSDLYPDCSCAFAAFLTHPIGSLQRIDLIKDEFVIETKDSHHHLSHILNLCSASNREPSEKIFGGIERELTISIVVDQFDSLTECKRIWANEIR